nr:transcription initiation factor TFIID subunit 11 [Pogona vitticeps]
MMSPGRDRRLSFLSTMAEVGESSREDAVLPPVVSSPSSTEESSVVAPVVVEEQEKEPELKEEVQAIEIKNNEPSELILGEMEESTSQSCAAKKIKIEIKEKKEKKHKVDEDEIQKMQ